MERLLHECVYGGGHSLRDHFHDNFEIIYVRGGTARLTMRDRSFDLRRGSVVFIGKLEAHAMEAREDYRRFYAVLRSAPLEARIADNRLTAVFRQKDLRLAPVYDLAPEAARLDALFDTIYREYRRGEEYADTLIAACLAQVLVYALRLRPPQDARPENAHDAAVYRAQAFMEQHFAQDIRIADIARDNFLSPEYFSRMFRQLTGYSPKRYLLEIRLAHSRSLLEHSGAPVQEIAHRSGFGDCNNFIRSFKAQYGKTPNKYRADLR